MGNHLTVDEMIFDPNPRKEIEEDYDHNPDDFEDSYEHFQNSVFGELYEREDE